MTRHAFIIGSPNCPGQKQLPGARQDVETWNTFLTSPEGGAWKMSEITSLLDPSKATAEVELVKNRGITIDYALLAFAGHGECVQTHAGREARLFLSSEANGYLTEKTFTLFAKRELLILDACREFRDERLILANFAKAALLCNEQMLSETNRFQRLVLSRKLFDEAIAANPLGRSMVYSCEVNELCADRPSFTQILIDEATEKVTADTLARVATIQEVFPLAENVVTTAKQPQHPVYEAGRRITHLPFAVSV